MKRFKFILILLCFLCTKSVAQTITHVTLTCYQPVKSQCNNEPLITADGSKINLHHLKHNNININLNLFIINNLFSYGIYYHS